MEPDNQTICQVMAPYYKCPLVIYEPSAQPVSHYLEGVDYNQNQIIAERVNYNPQWIKLVLKPLSKITDNDALEVGKMFRCCSSAEIVREHFIKYPDCVIPYQIYQYLQSKGYDLPHYLLGGKTLHKANLAIYK